MRTQQLRQSLPGVVIGLVMGWIVAGWHQRQATHDSIDAAIITAVMHEPEALADALKTHASFVHNQRKDAQGRDVFGIFEAHGVHVLQTHYYSAVPAVSQVAHRNLYSLDGPPFTPAQLEENLALVDLNVPGALAFMDQCVSDKYADEFKAIRKEINVDAQHEYYIDNQGFGHNDGSVLYCMLRINKPRRMIEVGMGYSTMLSSMALKQNAEKDGKPCRMTSVEPYPTHDFQQAVVRGLGKQLKVVVEMVQDVKVDVFLELEAGDVLFIDCSHVLAFGSDALFLFTKVVPRLKKGVIVHVHDIFLPYEYPMEWIAQEHRFWNENYFMQAFLTGNKDFKVLFPVAYMGRHHRGAYQKIIPDDREVTLGGSLWMQRV